MISLRRYAVYIGLAVFFLLALVFFREPIISRAPFRASLARPSAAVLDPSDPNFRWEDVPVNYPVKHLAPLPTNRPHRLPLVQHKFGFEPVEQAATRKKRQAAVKKAFQRCWQSYREHAWMKDELA